MIAGNRREFLRLSVALAGVLAAACGGEVQRSGRIPVIFDTDIGDDIDDTWALLMLLHMPLVDVQLIVGDYGNAIYRARLVAKLLQVAGRVDVPVGVGIDKRDDAGNLSAWLGDYGLDDYPGEVREDGVTAIIDTVHASPVPVTVLCVGPLPNIAEALRRDPSIAGNARIVGMYGSIFSGYDGSPTPVAEWNVRVDPMSLQQVFAAAWDITIAPLDTCGLVVLDGEDYRRIHDSDDPRLQALMQSYRIWLPGREYMDPATDPGKVSSTLFDTVAVYLAVEQDLVEMRDLPLRVTDDGYTVIDPEAGRVVHCATRWKDLDAFKKRLTNILISSGA